MWRFVEGFCPMSRILSFLTSDRLHHEQLVSLVCRLHDYMWVALRAGNERAWIRYRG